MVQRKQVAGKSMCGAKIQNLCHLHLAFCVLWPLMFLPQKTKERSMEKAYAQDT